MRWERIEDAEGMRSREDLNCDRWIQTSVLTVTPRDQLMEVTGRGLGSAERDQVLQHAVTGHAGDAPHAPWKLAGRR